MLPSLSLAQSERFQKFGIQMDEAAEAQIDFWKKIYSEYTSHEFVVHDPRQMGKIFASYPTEKEARAHKGELMRIQSGQKDLIARAQERSKDYVPRMEELLAEEGVPPELLKLTFVESSFNQEAHSKVGAIGVWQFMPATASRDLRVTDAIDERYDPLKSTRAAARFLKRNYNQFQSWSLAILAYHQGPGLVEKATRTLHTKDPLKIIREFKDPNFQFASKNYLFEFLAVVDLKSDARGTLPTFITVSFPKKMKMLDVLIRYNLKKAPMEVLNPHFRKSIWEGKSFIPAHYPVRMAGITLEEYRKVKN